FLAAGGWLKKCAYRGELAVVANITPGADLFPVDVIGKFANDAIGSGVMSPAPAEAAPAAEPSSSAAPAAPSWWDQNGGALTKGLAVGAGAA
ncbi:hypothetical protein, partial [Xylella fastidiosa]|uniref:hypothetical protein n=1 Tax=Xylella fastidiosa TaxID=2371 RepID=UPI00193112F6